MREQEIDRLSNILAEKDQELVEIEERIKSTGSASSSNLYCAMKGDAVDEYLAKYINLMQCKVPIKRLGNGYYLFGTRKIFAKIMNGKLVIRVGGGYMIIEEFIATYADQEINRYKMIEAQQQINGEDGGGRVGQVLKQWGAKITSGGSPRTGKSK